MLSGRKAFKRGHGERHDRGDPQGGAAGADAVGAQRLAGPGSHRQALPGEGPGPAVPDGQGRCVRALGGSRRRRPERRERRADRRCRRQARAGFSSSSRRSSSWPRGFFLAAACRTAAQGEAGGVKRVAVLPFENLGAPEDDYFADGIADEIRGKLTSLPGLQVIARGSSTPYKKTTKTPKQIAEELEVGYLLTATVRWEKSAGGNRVHVSPELDRDLGFRSADVQVAAAVRRGDHGRVPGAVGDRDEGGAGAGRARSARARRSGFPRSPRRISPLTTPSSRVRRSGTAEPTIPPACARRSASTSRPWPGSRLRAGVGGGLEGQFAPVRRQHPHARPRGACPAGGGEGRRACPEPPRGVPGPRCLRTVGFCGLQPRPGALREGAAPCPRRCLVFSGERRWPSRASDAGMRPWSISEQAERLDPRSVGHRAVLGDALLRLRRYPEAREAFDRGLALAPANLDLIENKAMTYLGEGDLAGARAVLKAAPKEVEPTALVAYLANYHGSRLGPRRGAARASAAADAERVRRRPGRLGPLPRSGLCLEGRCRERAHLRRGSQEGLRGAASRSAQGCGASRRSRPRAGISRSERRSDPGGRARRRARSDFEGCPATAPTSSTSSCGSTCSSASRRRRSTSSSRC